MTRPPIVVIDYGMGNLRSVVNKCRQLAETSVTSDPSEIRRAAKIVLPGVGHFGRGMESLKQLGLLPVLRAKVLEERIPVLGICLGMQLFTDHSEEGDCEGLGWIRGRTERLDAGGLKVPHMGWNSIQPARGSQLLQGLPPEDTFYFVHSFCVRCATPDTIAATSEYGERFVSAVEQENIYGVQFHPEKSHDQGFRILTNFADLPVYECSGLASFRACS